jgi:putative holliday junction resolvase
VASHPPGRVLGLDLGDARIGVAISDDERRLAVPMGTVHVGHPPGEFEAIRSIVEENWVSLVVLGHPLSMSGERGQSATRAEGFAEILRGVLEVSVELQDERLSTVEAGKALREAGKDDRSARRTVDSSAATVILQGWLDRNH